MNRRDWRKIADAQQVILEQAMERIRELEAELAIQKATTEKWWKAAEKAEAEVERLKSHTMYVCPNCGFDKEWGGGRDSAGREAELARENSTDTQPPAAQLKRRRCPNSLAGNWEYLDSRLPWPKGCPSHPAARKEAKA